MASYQYATPEEKSAQRQVWGSLGEPAANSMETYPCLLMYDKEGFLYGRVQGPVLLRGTIRTAYTGWSWVDIEPKSRYLYYDLTHRRIRDRVLSPTDALRQVQLLFPKLQILLN